MNTPPNPGINAILLAVASKMGFIGTVGARGAQPELGVLVDATTGAEVPLYLVGAGGAECAWATDDAARKAGCIPHLMSRATYLVLHEGVLDAVGASVIWQGRSYVLQATWDGFRPVVVAVAVA